ncbi:MAG TPA: DUF2332 domain-containing protein, partial [Caulobacteraceae bacterium]|nr:DUF2332 domain-containing protein [Caulobacteraceae bacterium]
MTLAGADGPLGPMDTERLIYVFDVQAEAFVDFGSPFMAKLGREAAADIRARGPSLFLLEPWAEASRRQMFDEATAIRLFAALHDLVLSGEEPALAAAFPSDDSPGDARAAWAAAREVIPRRLAQMTEFMTHEPQTNEVRRSAALLGGFLEVARATGLSLRCVEVGASAGLNQFWNRFSYDLGGGRRWGDEASAVKLVSDWRGRTPSLEPASIKVVERMACDRRPVRLADPLERRRLQAFVWPDKRDRLANLRAAIDLALAEGVKVEQADATAFIRERAAPKAGAATVVFHSIFFQYMPKESQDAMVAAIAAHGRETTADSPFAWVRLEPQLRDLKTINVRLNLWPGGEERVLAVSHPHGTWV